MHEARALPPRARCSWRPATARATRPLVRHHPSYGVGDEVFDIDEADVDDAPPADFDVDEVLAVRWFTEADVASMCLSGAIVDGLSLTPLLLLCAREGWATR